MHWRRMDDKKQCRIVYAKEFEGYDKESWPEMITWLSEHIRVLEAAFAEPLTRVGRSVRLQDESEE